jgi:aminocarboxymuconate-semialdehyde decarboxylase
MRKLVLDALVYAPGPLRAAEALVGAGRLVFGTDHPFAIADPAANIAAIDGVFEGAARDSVRGAAAEALFDLPLLQPGS